MNITDSNKGYGVSSIVLHWIIAILVIGLFLLGEYMVDLDYYDQWYHSAPWWHKSIGMILFSLLSFRLCWKLINDHPEPLSSYKLWEITIAKITHLSIYILLLIICTSGYFIATAKGVGIEIFDWFNIPAIISLNVTLADILGFIHEWASLLLAILFILHLTAALKHHFIDKDVTLIRIIKPIKHKENIK